MGINYQTPDDLDPKYKVDHTWPWSNAKENIEFKLGNLKALLMSCLTVQAPNTIDMMQKTNNRVYREFQRLDLWLSQNPSIPNANFGFATRYRSYMNDLISQRSQIASFVKLLFENIHDDLYHALGTAGFRQDEYDLLLLAWAAYWNNYGVPERRSSWDFTISWTWDTSNVRRDVSKRADSCPITAPAPKPSCSLQDQDPSRFIYSAFCICESSLNYPEVPSTTGCGYTSLPSQTINPTATLPVTTTNCQVCTQVNVNEDSCTTIPDCTPTPTADPTPKVGYMIYTWECSSPQGSESFGTTYYKVAPNGQDPCVSSAEILVTANGKIKTGDTATFCGQTTTFGTINPDLSIDMSSDNGLQSKCNPWTKPMPSPLLSCPGPSSNTQCSLRPSHECDGLVC